MKIKVQNQQNLKNNNEKMVLKLSGQIKMRIYHRQRLQSLPI